MKSFESTITCKYFTWISSRGARRMEQEGALFAGLIRDVPTNLKPYLAEIQKADVGKQYVALAQRLLRN